MVSGPDSASREVARAIRARLKLTPELYLGRAASL
jgi:hypothetical protein